MAPFLGCPAPFWNEAAEPLPVTECTAFEVVRTSEIEDPLANGQFESLDARLRRIQTAIEADIACEGRGRDAFLKFNHRHDWMRAELDGWVEAMPDSWVARSARAIHLVSIGNERRISTTNELRSGKLPKDTAKERFAKVGEIFAQAEADIGRAIELYPKHLMSYEQAIRIAMGRGQHKVSKRAVELALEQVPGSLEIRLTYLQSLQPRWGGSLRAIERFAKRSQRYAHENPKVPWLLGYPDAERGRIARDEEKFTEAAQHFDKALEYGHVYGWLEYSLLLWDQVGNNMNTVRAANRLLEHHPNDVQALRLRGKAYVEIGNVERGLADLDRAHALGPDDYYVAADRAYVFRGLSRFAEAEQAFRRSLEIEPNSEWALRGLGRLLNETLGQPEEAEEIRQRLAALDADGS
jgi:tetratricopeptide (TPR) repeat protein